MRDTRGGGKYKRGEEGGCEEEEGRNIWKRMMGEEVRGKDLREGVKGHAGLLTGEMPTGILGLQSSGLTLLQSSRRG